ncbi:hypothetical protein M0R45_020863 [Rubus argutus]|uniref:F-box protein n=1 Tax=Rubus argutus TaxID=59490 RepID=A0AAW1XBT1_RUBAR
MVKVKGDEERSLYICTVEELESPIRRRYRIHSITLSDLLSKRSIELQKSLHEVARLEGPDLPLHMDCSIYGSQIIFTGVVELASPPLTDSSDSEDREPSSDDNNDSSDDRGERMFVFETDPTLDPSPSIKRESFPEFNSPMHHPLLVELAGDLYALGWDEEFPNYASFEVFKQKDKRWLPVYPTFPFEKEDEEYDSNYFSYAVVGGTKMLVSGPKTPVYCLDAAATLGKWNWRTNVGYQVYELIAYRMLNDDYSIERIRAFDPSIITSWGWDIGYDAPLKYSFAHLGGRRVCLTEARFVSHETQKHGIGMMRLFVSTFEFSFEDGNDGSRSFSVKSLLDYSADSSRIFQLLLDDPQESGDATLLNAQLLGCFVL